MQLLAKFKTVLQKVASYLVDYNSIIKKKKKNGGGGGGGGEGPPDLFLS